MAAMTKANASDAVCVRYGLALYETACAAGAEERVCSELNGFCSDLRSNKELSDFLLSPLNPGGAKKNVLAELLKDSCAITENFLSLLVDKDRLEYAEGILLSFEELVRNEKNEENAVVVSASALSAEKLGEIKAALEKSTGKHITVTDRVDESLIGGIVVRIGDKLFDSSVRKKLDDLKNRLKTLRVETEASEVGSNPTGGSQ